MDIADVMGLAPVMPVLVIDEVDYALPIAQALVAGGLFALEVTLRTPCALDAIRMMSDVPGAVVGAGSVLNPRDLDAALEAGAQFIVSPGLTEALGQAAIDRDVAFLPGTSTATDVMRGFDIGLTHFKFFPAVASGGVPALMALIAPLRQARFCPTGGITANTAAEWLAIPEVSCVGSSWIVPRGAPDIRRITAEARFANALQHVAIR